MPSMDFHACTSLLEEKLIGRGMVLFSGVSRIVNASLLFLEFTNQTRWLLDTDVVIHALYTLSMLK